MTGARGAGVGRGARPMELLAGKAGAEGCGAPRRNTRWRLLVTKMAPVSREESRDRRMVTTERSLVRDRQQRVPRGQWGALRHQQQEQTIEQLRWRCESGRGFRQPEWVETSRGKVHATYAGRGVHDFIRGSPGSPVINSRTCGDIKE